MSHLKHHHPNCLNCHYPLAEFDAFCPNCGQKPMNPKSSMHDLLHEFFHTFWHLDGKFFQTLHHLLIPGKLTTEFFKGHLKRYAHPIQLFLVLGAFAFGMLGSQMAKTEEKAEAVIEKSRDSYKRKDFLRELDSARHALIPPQYADARMQLLSDSLMFKMLYPKGMEFDKDKLEKETNDILDKEFNKRYNIDQEKNRLKMGKKDSSAALAFSIEYEDDDIKNRRDDFKDSIINASIEFEKNEVHIREKANSLRSDSLRKAGRDPNSWSDAVEGFNDGFHADERENANQKLLRKLRPKIEEQKRTRNLKEAIQMHEDTNSLGFMGKTIKVPTREVYELTADSMVKKYDIKGFWYKMGFKQSIKAVQNPSGLIHFYMAKLFWATVTMLPALALFLSLMYWRRHRFYVEHVVFLIHFNTAAFLVLIPTLLISKYYPAVLTVYGVWFCVHFIASLKAYYQQSWGKTLFKSFVIGISYMFIASIFIAIGAIVGFIFF